MASFVDACIFVAAGGGTGSFVVSTAKVGWRTPAQASAVNGATYRYRAFSDDQTEWEVGTGVYTSGTTTLTRAVILDSSNGGAATNFSAPPNVAVTIFSADFATPAQLAKVDFISITQPVDLDALETQVSGIDTDLGVVETKLAFITVTQSVDLDTMETKTNHISVTQAVNLDTMESDIAALQASLGFGGSVLRHAILGG